MKQTLLVLILLVLTGSAAWTLVPQTLSYQGVLTDGEGHAIADGTYNLTFKIYYTSYDVSPLWSETQVVPVEGGIFSVNLGDTTALSIPFDYQYWLGVSVNGGGEMSPRRRLTSAAYSLNSQSVAGGDNVFSSSGNVGIGDSSPNHPLHVSADEMIGIQYDGTLAASWASIAVNATGAGSSPSYEYYRLNGYIARTYVDDSNNWKLQVGGTSILLADYTTSNFGIGSMTPAEKLDVNGGIRVGHTFGTNAGTIRWNGSDFQGYDGSEWKSLTDTGDALPTGSWEQTIYHNGSQWTASNNLYHNGTYVGIGTSNLTDNLSIREDAGKIIGITIENHSTDPGAAERISFANEEGSVCAIQVRGSGAAQPNLMRIFNNRPGGNVELASGYGEFLVESEGNITLQSFSGGIDLYPEGGHITVRSDVIPSANNIYTLGNSDDLFKEVWAINGTIQTSDARLKENITDLEYGLDEVMELHPVSFSWRDDPENDTKLGLIAQEVEPVIGEVVAGNERGAGEDSEQEYHYLGLNYSQLVPVLIKAVQEQQTLIQTQSEKIKELEARISKLETQ